MYNYNGGARDSERLQGSLWRGYTVEYEFKFVDLQHSREFEIWRDRENNSDIGRGGQGKMKYKVGDKVRIVSESGKGCCQNSSGKMDKWCWTENWIAGLARENKIVITSDGEKTLARLYDGNKIIKTATAKCSPDDNFDFETGATIAFDRLFDKHEKEESKYFNGKAVCVKEYPGFTVGRIYEFVNGQCLDDQKTLRPTCDKCKDLSWFNGVFIPLVE